jgi:hypothetical protein
MTIRGGALRERGEIWIVWILGWIALAAVPLLRGEAGIVWDALNHHIYLGWIAFHPRFDRDFIAAGWQSFQYPYLYWPAYKLAVSGASGVTAGVVFASLQSLAVPPLWLVARSVCPGARVEDVALRFLGVGLALAGGLTLSLVDTTSNDVLAGVPLLWAVALGLMANDAGVQERRRWTLVALSGACAGVSVAFKLSNGPLALVLPLLWAWCPGPWRAIAMRVLLGGVMTVLAALATYAPWGWAMWHHFGNPLYPFRDDVFQAVRAYLHWSPP